MKAITRGGLPAVSEIGFYIYSSIVSCISNELERHYEIPEVAKALGISRKTLWVWVKEGKVKAVRVGRPWVIPRSEVEKLMGKGDSR